MIINLMSRYNRLIGWMLILLLIRLIVPTRTLAGNGTQETQDGKSSNVTWTIQEDIILLLSDMDGTRIYRNRDEFRRLLESAFKGLMKLPPYFWDVMMDALSEKE